MLKDSTINLRLPKKEKERLEELDLSPKQIVDRFFERFTHANGSCFCVEFNWIEPVCSIFP